MSMPLSPLTTTGRESDAFRAALEVVGAVEPSVAAAIRAELADQRGSLKLIASENYASPAVLLAMGNWFSDKYAEGTIGRRMYAGCQNVDTIEQRLPPVGRYRAPCWGRYAHRVRCGSRLRVSP